MRQHRLVVALTCIVLAVSSGSASALSRVVVTVVGRGLDIKVKLAFAQGPIVTGDSPLLDAQRISVGTTITRQDLENLPTPRDPWSILSQAPGVLLDRVNVGGNETGETSTVVGPGSSNQAVWAVDGVVITDMSALGSTPTYFDFGAIEDLQITTGGADATLLTGGVGINIVTKRRSNDLHGSGQFFVAPGPLVGGYSDKQFLQPGGNRPDSTLDFGGDLGGPIIKDKLWFWGSYGRQDSNRVALAGGQTVPRDFGANSLAGHGEFRINATNRLNAQVLITNYNRVGEGASPLVGPYATWRQAGTPSLIKISDSFTVGPNFYFTPFYSHYNAGFTRTPLGGSDTPYFDSRDILQGSNLLLDTSRPAQQFQIDGGTSLKSGPRLSQDFKFGASYRRFGVDSKTDWPANVFVLPGASSLVPFAVFPLGISTSIRNNYTSMYAQDTLTRGNLTVDLGLRFDRQTGTNESSIAVANPLRPIDVPGISYKGGEAGFTWTSFSPGLSLTYALREERKTLLRASYRRFADQLGTGTTSWLNPLAQDNFLSGAALQSFTDLNGNHVPDGNEPVGGVTAFGVRATNPLFLQPLNQLNPDLKAPVTTDLLLGVEHALLPEFVVGVNLRYRRRSSVLDQTDLVAGSNQVARPVTFDDWVAGPVVTGLNLAGEPFSQPTFTLNPALDFTGGQLLSNGAREQVFKGIDLTFDKRFSNRWAFSGNVLLNDWSSTVPGTEPADRNNLIGSQDRAPVAPQSSAPNKASVFINSKWQYSVRGSYTIPSIDLDVSANLTGRQGYPLPLYAPVTGADFVTRQIQIGNFDTVRLDSIRILDIGVSKGLELGSAKTRVMIYLDFFNALNSQSVLQEDNNLLSLTKGAPTELLGPRILRLGARLKF